MANLLQKTIQRSTFPAISMDQWVQFFDFGGLSYPYTQFHQTISGHVEDTDGAFEGLVHSAFKSNGVVFACMLARQLAFSEARFMFRQRTNGRPGQLFGTKELEVLERPWPGGVTADLLSRAIQDVDLAGNFFAVRRPKRIRRLRPDWVTIVLGSMDDPSLEAGDIDAEVVGFIYHPGGRGSGREPVFLLREQVAHFAPIPDPAASFRGISWLIPVINEFSSDSAMISHKKAFFTNGATPNMVVTLDPSIKKEAFAEWVKMFSDKHEGALNAYKTLYLGAGSTITPVGKDFKQMEFSITQAAGETRLAAAAGVPPIIVGLSEGLKSATYSNYGQARRRFADMTMRPLWRSMATSLEILINAPSGAELWYDDRDIPFLVEDFKDRAEVQAKNASAMRTLIDSGFEPKTVVEAVNSNDLSKLVHTGFVSVQLWRPGESAKQPSAQDMADATTLKAEKQPDQSDGDGTPADKPAEAKPAKKTPKEKKSQENTALEILRDAFVRLGPQPSPNVDVHFHDGAFRNESPVTVEAPTTFHDGAIRSEPHIQVDAPTTIEDGAVRVESPVTFADGALRSDVKVDAPVTISEGAVRVEAPTTIAEGAFRADAPQVTVESPIMTIERGAVQIDAPVTVEPTQVEIADGAIRSVVELRDGAIHVLTPVTVEEGAVRVEAPVTIAEGAVQVSSPVTVERTEVHVDPGAVQVSSPITVERTEVHIDEGAVHVPVTVERTEVHVDEGAVQVSAPVTVERTEVHVDPGAVQVHSPVTIEEGAVRVESPVTIEPAEIRVESPITVEKTEVLVRIEEGAVKVDTPVTLSEGAIRVDSPVTIEPGAVEVRVDSPVQISEGAIQVEAPVTIERGAVEVQVDPPDVTVEAPEVKRGRVVRETEFRTDEEGKIIGKREVETDEPEE